MSQALNESAINLHNTAIETEALGTTARFDQAIALTELHDKNGWKTIEKEDGSNHASWFDYCQAVAPSLHKSTLSTSMRVIRGFQIEINKGRKGELARIGFDKLATVLSMYESKIFDKLDEAIEAARTKSLSQLREMRPNPDGRSGVSLYAEPVPSLFRSQFQQSVERFRTAIRHTNESASALDALTLITQTLATLPDSFILEQAEGIGGAVPDTIAGYDLTSTPPSTLLDVLAEKYIDLGYTPKEVLEEMTQAINKQQILSDSRAFEAAAEKKAAEKIERAKLAEEKKASKELENKELALSKALDRVAKLQDGVTITFVNGMEAVCLGSEAVGQTLGVKWLTKEGVELAKTIKGVKTSSDQSTLPYRVVIENLGGVLKTKAAPKAKVVPTPKAKAVKAEGQFSKAAQAGKSSKKNK